LAEKRPVVAVSGGFDPPTTEQVFLLKSAAELGEVFVYLNSDDWCGKQRTSGKPMAPYGTRKGILMQLPYVSRVLPAKEDENGSLCAMLELHKPDFFAKGYWSRVDKLPELQTCRDNDIMIVWFVHAQDGFAAQDAALDLQQAITSSQERQRKKAEKREKNCKKKEECLLCNCQPIAEKGRMTKELPLATIGENNE
jgi:glycerol-3-phosphate cytidylyltransferase-like family protein